MKRVFLGLGSNKEFGGWNSLQLLRRACGMLCEFLSGSGVSSVYRTKPMYYENQCDFYNMVFYGYAEDSLSPHELLDRIHVIESTLGRDRSVEIRNGPRSMDIDIEFFGDESVDEIDLQIPHPRIYERPFVLVPLLEILSENADIQIDGFSKSHIGAELGGLEPAVTADDFMKLPLNEEQAVWKNRR